MFSREELLKSPEYWFEGEQDELFRQVSSYMENENINQSELAKRLQVSRGYVSQILAGEFNFTMKKIIEIGLAIGLVPQINYTPVEAIIKEEEAEKKTKNVTELSSYHISASGIEELINTSTNVVKETGDDKGNYKQKVEILRRPQKNQVA